MAGHKVVSTIPVVCASTNELCASPDVGEFLLNGAVSSVDVEMSSNRNQIGPVVWPFFLNIVY